LDASTCSGERYFAFALQQTFDSIEDKDLEGNWEERLVLFIALKRILKSDK
jgi:hypothetical protein